MKRSRTNRPDVARLEGRTLLSMGGPCRSLSSTAIRSSPGKPTWIVYRAVLDSQTTVLRGPPLGPRHRGPETATALVTPGSDPGDLGPLAVSHVEYAFGDSAFTPTGPGFPSPWPVELTASLTYPTDLSGGPYPLIVLVHGRHLSSAVGHSGRPSAVGRHP